MKRRIRRILLILCGVLVVLAIVAYVFASEIGAYILVHPFRRTVPAAPAGLESVTLQGEGIKLHGWRGRSVDPASNRGTVIFLHGVMDTRASGAWVLAHFRERGFDTIAYDSRAHGESEGEVCTYGVLEKEDLRKVIQQCKPGPVILIGTSLGGAIALQTAPIEPRISAVVAAEVFTDVRTAARERAAPFLSENAINRAFELAESWGKFRLEEASPLRAASEIQTPVFLIHGALDTETPPAHSESLYQALKGPKKLSLVPGAGHNQSLSALGWQEIDDWLSSILPK